MLKPLAPVALLLASLLVLAGCQKSDTKILIGATAIVADGAPPLADSVIVVSGKTIRAVGLQKDVPIPQDSERTDLAGKWLLPMPGGHIVAGEPADLLVQDGPSSAVIRQLTHGEWVPSVK